MKATITWGVLNTKTNELSGYTWANRDGAENSRDFNLAYFGRHYKVVRVRVLPVIKTKKRKRKKRNKR